MNLKSGIIEVNDEVISPGYNFTDFQKSSFFDGQDGIGIIKIKDIVQIENSNYVVSLFFRNKNLYIMSLVCVDIDIPFSEEIKRKQLHDKILKEHGLNDKSVFEWGSIESVYDPKGNVSSVNIVYGV